MTVESILKLEVNYSVKVGGSYFVCQLSLFFFPSLQNSCQAIPLLLHWSSSQLCLKLYQTSTLHLASRESALEPLPALSIGHICLRRPLPAAMD